VPPSLAFCCVVAEDADSIIFCLSEGYAAGRLSAPRRRQFIFRATVAEARRGGMRGRRAGGGGIMALESMIDRLAGATPTRNCWRRVWSRCGVTVNPIAVQTNIVIFRQRALRPSGCCR
jgi:hypothetical protein